MDTTPVGVACLKVSSLNFPEPPISPFTLALWPPSSDLTVEDKSVHLGPMSGYTVCTATVRAHIDRSTVYKARVRFLCKTAPSTRRPLFAEARVIGSDPETARSTIKFVTPPWPKDWCDNKALAHAHIAFSLNLADYEANPDGMINPDVEEPSRFTFFKDLFVNRVRPSCGAATGDSPTVVHTNYELHPWQKPFVAFTGKHHVVVPGTVKEDGKVHCISPPFPSAFGLSTTQEVSIAVSLNQTQFTVKPGELPSCRTILSSK
jgi:hypothetical protein